MQSREIEIINNSVENYIINPKPSGYRALHVLANINYNSFIQKELMVDKIIFEIQIRTRLQDAWGDITHELYYRTKYARQADRTDYSLLQDISKRFLQEDNELLKLKNIYTLMDKV